MFVQNLNEVQQGILLASAEEIAKADRELHEIELSMITILKEQVKKGVQSIQVDMSELENLFSNNREKYSFMLELIGIAYANGEYHKDEKLIISRYAQALSIDEKKLIALEDWVSKQIDLTKEAEDLIGI